MKIRSLFAVLVIASLLLMTNCYPTDTTTISGTVRLDSPPMAGITVQVQHNGSVIATGITEADGEYVIAVEETGTGRVAPVSNDYTFDPTYQDVQLTGTAVSGIDFNATESTTESLVLHNPMSGIENKDWTINNYLDLSAGSNIDYRDNSRSYDGHTGTDFDVASFRQMDQGYQILAAADGVVEQKVDGFSDRNVDCVSNYGNYVLLRHANGWKTFYMHLRSDNTLVNVGDEVAVGDPIGIVGSSGCSTQPHLHFEVRNPNGNSICPFDNNMWDTAPVYDSPVQLMDTVLADGGIASGDSDRAMKDPPAVNSTTGRLYRLFGFGIHMGGGTGAETITQSVIRPDGTTQLSNIYTSAYGHRWWYVNFYPNRRGTWRFEVRINGVTVSSNTVQIN